MIDISALDAMIDHAPMNAARAELLAVHERRQAMAAQLTDARRALAEAEAARAGLVAKAGDGAAVTPGETVEVELSVRAAESHLLFLQDAGRALAIRESAAQSAIADAQADAARPIAARAAAEFLSAARKRDAAALALADAERAIEAAVAGLHHAQARGWRLSGAIGPTIAPAGWQNEHAKKFPTAAQALDQLRMAGAPIPEPVA